MTPLVLVMGVSGAGKSTVGSLLAARLGVPFADADAFHPAANWYDSDVLGIDQGISVLMAENLRSGLVWETFMRNPECKLSMQRAGFHPTN